MRRERSFGDVAEAWQPDAARRRLDRAMVKAAWSGAGDADIVALLVAASLDRISKDTKAILGNLGNRPMAALIQLVALAKLAREVPDPTTRAWCDSC